MTGRPAGPDSQCLPAEKGANGQARPGWGGGISPVAWPDPNPRQASFKFNVFSSGPDSRRLPEEMAAAPAGKRRRRWSGGTAIIQGNFKCCRGVTRRSRRLDAGPPSNIVCESQSPVTAAGVRTHSSRSRARHGQDPHRCPGGRRGGCDGL